MKQPKASASSPTYSSSTSSLIELEIENEEIIKFKDAVKVIENGENCKCKSHILSYYRSPIIVPLLSVPF